MKKCFLGKKWNIYFREKSDEKMFFGKKVENIFFGKKVEKFFFGKKVEKNFVGKKVEKIFFPGFPAPGQRETSTGGELFRPLLVV